LNAEQYLDWMEFSCSMARHYPHATDARRRRLAKEVDYWFEELSDQEYWRHMIDWDNSEEMPEMDHYGRTQRYDYCCDLFTESFDDHDYHHNNPDREYKFHTQLACCIRAGIDLAGKPAAGVLGFTIGDLKHIFGGVIPQWVCDISEADLNRAEDKDGIWL